MRRRRASALRAGASRPTTPSCRADSTFPRDTEADLRKAIELLHAGDAARSAVRARVERAVAGLDRPRSGFLGARRRRRRIRRRARRSTARSASRRSSRPRTLPGVICFRMPISTGAGRKRSFAGRWSWRRTMARRNSRLGSCSRLSVRWSAAIELTQQALATEPLRAGGTEGSRSISLASSGSMRQSGRPQGHRAAAWCGDLSRAAHDNRDPARRCAGSARRRTAGAPGYAQDIALALARQIGGDRIAADAALKTLIDKDASCCLSDRLGLRAAQRRRRPPSSGSIGPGPTAIQESPISSTIPSSCATRTILASLPSAARSDYRCPAQIRGRA